MQQFSLEHIVGLLATALAAAVLVAIARARAERWAAGAAQGLAIMLVLAYLAEHITYVTGGTWTVRQNLPLHLTDAVVLVAAAALWWPRTAILVELVYFWSLSAGLQAVLTPGVAEPFPHVLYFTYFVIHSGPIVAACLLVLGCRRIPRPRAAWRVYGLTLAFAGVAAIGHRDHGRQLHVPAPQASAQFAAGRDGPVGPGTSSPALCWHLPCC